MRFLTTRLHFIPGQTKSSAARAQPRPGASPANQPAGSWDVERDGSGPGGLQKMRVSSSPLPGTPPRGGKERKGSRICEHLSGISWHGTLTPAPPRPILCQGSPARAYTFAPSGGELHLPPFVSAIRDSGCWLGLCKKQLRNALGPGCRRGILGGILMPGFSLVPDPSSIQLLLSWGKNSSCKSSSKAQCMAGKQKATYLQPGRDSKLWDNLGHVNSLL